MADEADEHNYDTYQHDDYTHDMFDEPEDENQDSPSINSMTSSTVEPHEQVNQFDTKNESHLNLIYRRMVAGQCFRLPNDQTCPDDIFESWLATFLSESVDDPHGKAKIFRYTWSQKRQGDHNVPVAEFHLAKDITGLIQIIKKGLVKRTDIRLPNNAVPTKTNWNEALKIQIFTPVHIPKNESQGIEAPIPATDAAYLSIFDCVVHYLTGGYYKGGLNINPGFTTMAYFKEHDENLKILKSAYKAGQDTITIDMLPAFKSGTYVDYRAVVAAVNRRYRRGYTQETMTDWFRKIDEAVKSNSPTEFKIQRLRALIEQKFIQESDKYPECSDFEGDLTLQSHPEEYNPIINTLFVYILLSSQWDKKDWDKIQRLYHQEIKGKADYLAWHGNRSELYRVMDEFQSTNNISQMDEIHAVRRTNISYQNRGRPMSRGSNRGQPRGQPRYNPPRQQQQYRPPTQKYTNNTKNIRRPQNRNTSQNRSQIQNRLKRLLCMHCSRCAGTNRYHQGPWGGGPNSNCPYDRNGNIRQGFQFVYGVFGEDVNNFNVEHYTEIESEGLDYGEPHGHVNHVSESSNHLIANALGDN